MTRTLDRIIFPLLSLRRGLTVQGDHGVSAGISDNIVWISTDKQQLQGFSVTKTQLLNKVSENINLKFNLLVYLSGKVKTSFCLFSVSREEEELSGKLDLALAKFI